MRQGFVAVLSSGQYLSISESETPDGTSVAWGTMNDIGNASIFSHALQIPEYASGDAVPPDQLASGENSQWDHRGSAWVTEYIRSARSQHGDFSRREIPPYR